MLDHYTQANKPELSLGKWVRESLKLDHFKEPGEWVRETSILGPL